MAADGGSLVATAPQFEAADGTKFTRNVLTSVVALGIRKTPSTSTASEEASAGGQGSLHYIR